MTLPLVITPGQSGHITDHEKIHALLAPIVSPFGIAEYAQGTFASRPAAGSVGRYYRATDTNVLYVDSGSGWVAIHDLLTTWEASLLSTGNNLTKFKVPTCIATKTVAQTISDGASTALTFPTEDFDNDGMHSVSSLTSRITINRSGLYLCGASVSWNLMNVTYEIRALSIRVNGTTSYSGPRADLGGPANFNAGQSMAELLPLSATDYIECIVLPNTTPAQSVDVNVARFWATMVSSM